MMLSGIIGSSLLWADLAIVYVWCVLLVTIGFGVIGFYDDYLKVTKQSDKGFSGKVAPRARVPDRRRRGLVRSSMPAPASLRRPRWPFPSSRN